MSLEKKIEIRDRVIAKYEDLGINSSVPKVRRALLADGMKTISKLVVAQRMEVYRKDPNNGVVMADLISDEEAMEVFAGIIPDRMFGYDKERLYTMMNENNVFVSGLRLAELWKKYKQWRRENKREEV